MMTAIDVGHDVVDVPYKGTPAALTGLMAGEVHHVRRNCLRAAAHPMRLPGVSIGTRSRVLPESRQSATLSPVTR